MGLLSRGLLVKVCANQDHGRKIGKTTKYLPQWKMFQWGVLSLYWSVLYVSICVCGLANAHMRARLSTRTLCTRTNTYLHMYIHTHKLKYTYTRTHTYQSTFTHLYTHIYTHTLSLSSSLSISRWYIQVLVHSITPKQCKEVFGWKGRIEQSLTLIWYTEVWLIDDCCYYL